MATLNSQRHAIEHAGWSDSFNLVIGDQIADRILFWNARQGYPSWRDGTSVDLYLPSSAAADATFVQAVGAYLTGRNFVHREGEHGVPRVTVRTISLDRGDIDSFAKQLRTTAHGQGVEVQIIESLDRSVPDALCLAGTDGRSRRSPDFEAGGHEYVTDGDSLTLPATEPAHLAHGLAEVLADEPGAWMVDLDIERSIDHSRFMERKPHWRLPHRLRIASVFHPPYKLSDGPYVNARTTRNGLLSLAVRRGHLPRITLPPDHEAVPIALTMGRDWDWIWNSEPPVPQLCYAAERSDAGQHFFGTFELFGSLATARMILMNTYWRGQFERLGATDQRAELRHEQVLTLLDKRMRGRAAEQGTPEHRRALANAILQVVDTERVVVRNRTWTQLQTDFEPAAERFLKDHGTTAEEEPREREMLINELRATVRWLCAREVFHQGYELKCSSCLHRNWLGIGSLAPTMRCQVCKTDLAAPIDTPWQFRLNGFVRDALQRHGIGPLFWVLSRFQDETRGAFWFEGPLSIYFDEHARQRRAPDTDIDLTVIHDGKVTMCEAKQSERGLRDPAKLARSTTKQHLCDV